MAKVSEIVDLFEGTSLNTARWTPSSSTGPVDMITVNNGTLTLGATPGHSRITSKETYDWTNSSLVIGPIAGRFQIPVSDNTWISRVANNIDIGRPGASVTVPYNETTMPYFKIESVGTNMSFYYSRNNYHWTLITTINGIASTDYPVVVAGMDYSGDVTLNAVNPPPNVPPSAELLSPTDRERLTTQTPQLVFRTTDPDGEAYTAQLQMSLTPTFDTVIVDALTASSPGFSGTDPRPSGSTITYTVQSPLDLGGVTYYWRVRARDPEGTNTWGQWNIQSVITEALPPEVTSLFSSNIGVTSATASGNVFSDGGGTITQRGIVYGTSPSPTTANSVSTALGTTGSFTANLSGLTASTLYYWRAYATNSKTTSYGETQTLITLPNIATINSISNIAHDRADVAVSIPAGGDQVTERGVVYATTPNPTVSNGKVVDNGTSGGFTTTITGLTGSTDYYVRAFATSPQGTSYSPQSEFTTTQQPGVPTLTTGEAINIGELSADFINSSVVLDGTEPVTERGVVYSRTNSDPTINDGQVADTESGLGTYDVSLADLWPESVYYVRSYAVNSFGVGYGPIRTFKTLPLFIPDEGDGYWTWQPVGSDVTVGRNQPTPAHSSANLLLSDLGLEDGEEYTLYFSEVESDSGEAHMVLQWYDNLVKQQQLIEPGVPYTFTYDKEKLSWAIRLFVTGDQPEPDDISATYKNLYLSKESEFSEFVRFIRKGLTEVKLDNNWLIDKRREDTIESIFDAIYGLGWSQFTAKTTGLGWLEIGDQITIVDDEGLRDVIVWNSSLTIDGGVKENLSADSPEKTETDYNKAGRATKTIRRTQISVDHNLQQIESIVEDVYSDQGTLNKRFTEIRQDLNAVTTTAQSSGGVNLVKNSVMYAFDDPNNVERVNIARGKPAGTAAPITVGNLTLLTDGNTATTSYVGAGSGNGWAMVDLGEVYEIDTVKVWHYYADNRTYNSPRTEVSEDGAEWVEVSAPDPYEETPAGHTRTFTPIRARYVRDYIDGSSANTGNHWVELEVYAVAQYVPNWALSGTGTLTIQASPESLAGGGISGNIFALRDMTVAQRVPVRMDADFVSEADKLHYSFSARVRKNMVGDARVVLSNRNESHTIELPDQREYYWEAISLEGLLPLDDHYDIQIYSDSDANLQVTDVMLSPGPNTRQWTQANGETMNTNVAVNDSGMTIRSNIFRNDYVRIDALGFEVHKHEAGGKRVFGFNGDETNVSKLRADTQISLAPIRMVPIDYDSYKGMAFTRTENR